MVHSASLYLDGKELIRKLGSGAPDTGNKVQERITHISPLNVPFPNLSFPLPLPLPLILVLSLFQAHHPQSTAGSGLETFQSIGNASRVLNIVSTGANEELYLTFTFEWEHAEILKGSEEELKRQREYQAAAPKAVEGTLKAIRRMVAVGEL